MARNKGQFEFSANFQVKNAAPLDPRVAVDTKAELIDKETWPYDGNTVYLYNGLLVAVNEEKSVYQLTNKDKALASDYSGWTRIDVNAGKHIQNIEGKQPLTIQLNGGSTEGTNKFTYNVESAKTVNITPANIGAANSSHNHTYIISKGRVTAISGTTKPGKGLSFVECYNNGYPTIFGNVLQIQGDGAGQLLLGWTEDSSLGRIYYRSLRDVINSWSSWGTLAYLTDITWNNISGKPSWIGSSKPSYAWSEITGKPSTFTPSSHTHPISQITNRGTLTFTGAATGSYDGSGNLTINIPEGGGGVADSVSWNNVTGKPSCYTPCEHGHVFADITFNNTGTNRQYLAGDGKFYTIRYSEVSGTPDLSDYITNADLSNYATQSWCNTQFTTTSKVNSLISDALSEFSDTDTKNTTGTSDSTSKLYLAGGTSQSSTGVVTYSNKDVYTQSGQLYATRMNSTNGFYETSDARLKDFKEDIKALDTVDKIPTKYFTWKEDENQESQIGTSAQEVEKLYPELVSKTEDDTLTVDYAKLSIIALAAIKELKAEIQSLKEEIKQLKSK